MCYNQVNNINKLFQSEKVVIHLLQDCIEGLYLSILKNFMDIKYISTTAGFKNAEFYLPISKMFFGIKFEKFCLTENFPPEIIISIKKDLLNFYIELCSQIQQRFDFQDTKLKVIRYLDPKNIVAGEISSILKLLHEFPYTNVDYEVVNSQYRELIGNEKIISKFYSNDILDFWINLRTLKNNLDEYIFRDLSNYMIKLCTLPHSSAAAERSFSTMNLIKNKKTNKLVNRTIKGIMLCKDMLREKHATIWEPNEDLLKYALKFKFVNGNFISC